MQNPLAISVLEGEFEDGDTIVVDRALGAAHLSFRPASAPAAAAAEPEVPAGCSIASVDEGPCTTAQPLLVPEL